LVILSSLAVTLVLAFTEVPLWVKLFSIAMSLIIIFSNIAVILLVAVSVEFFKCEKCGEKFVPTLTAYVFGPHTLNRRYLKCPHCGKKSWNKSNIRK
ncbi:MAG: hypothetical protein K2O67_04005, partial [Clostridia bacterium]|nr:hypothetical protein [Clostridia bacterium]